MARMDQRSPIRAFSRVPSSQRMATLTKRPSNRRSASVARRESTPRRGMSQPLFNFGDKITHVKKKLSSFTELDIPSSTKEIKASDNLLVNLNGLGSLKDLEVLDVSNNKIRSFTNFPHLCKLQSINISGNSGLVGNEYYRIALIVLYPTLRIINGELVKPNELRISREYTPEHASLLRSGWQIKYPPPKGTEILNTKRQIANQMTARGVSRAAPKVAAPVPRKQSDVLNERLKHQEDEMKALMAELNKLRK